MRVEIGDDFDLEKIYQSGQCFRIRKYDDGGYRFISGDHVVYIRQRGDGAFAVSCGEAEWEDFWFSYFDLGRDYRKIRENAYGKDDFADRAMDFSRGIRVLRQDPWETLVTFLISQRKNIPAIAKSVELLANSHGSITVTEFETIPKFPAPDELARATEEELRACALGYRAPYVVDAADRVSHGRLDLGSLAESSDEELLRELQTVRGVGAKIANCVALFSYARMSCVPVDVWISRAIEEDCHGCSPFPLFGEDAGIIQQYIFYYERSGGGGSGIRL